MGGGQREEKKSWPQIRAIRGLDPPLEVNDRKRLHYPRPFPLPLLQKDKRNWEQLPNLSLLPPRWGHHRSQLINRHPPVGRAHPSGVAFSQQTIFR